jgi:ElaB/YqjD/DUF883 family membrane-anchored ribosome-binding protein
MKRANERIIMTANAESSEKLATDLKRLVQDSEVLLEDSAAAASEKARAARERLAQALETAKANCVRLQAKAKEGAKATDQLIHEHPYKAMGVALSVGVLIGWLVRRR